MAIYSNAVLEIFSRIEQETALVSLTYNYIVEIKQSNFP
jgi:hypothetical protein